MALAACAGMLDWPAVVDASNAARATYVLLIPEAYFFSCVAPLYFPADAAASSAASSSDLAIPYFSFPHLVPRSPSFINRTVARAANGP